MHTHGNILTLNVSLKPKVEDISVILHIAFIFAVARFHTLSPACMFERTAKAGLVPVSCLSHEYTHLFF